MNNVYSDDVNFYYIGEFVKSFCPQGLDLGASLK